MNTFYFDTGVKPWNCNGLTKGQVWRNGTKQIPFDADVPKNSTLMFLCDNPNLGESRAHNVRVVEVHNTVMVSKYAYFRVYNKSFELLQDNERC